MQPNIWPQSPPILPFVALIPSPLQHFPRKIISYAQLRKPASRLNLQSVIYQRKHRKNSTAQWIELWSQTELVLNSFLNYATYLQNYLRTFFKSLRDTVSASIEWRRHWRASCWVVVILNEMSKKSLYIIMVSIQGAPLNTVVSLEYISKYNSKSEKD